MQGFKVAYVVFKTSSSVDRALELDSSETRLLSTEENPIRTGLKSKYIKGWSTQKIPWSQSFLFATKRRDKREKEAARENLR